ncbi:MAG TPA: prolyl oligopeptidase family serine peptidase [Candidatus Elarobacter sp.]|nr:prolyl oligopeptidase family serine peptidase [Candidatus Elarobacter sp.]
MRTWTRLGAAVLALAGAGAHAAPAGGAVPLRAFVLEDAYRLVSVSNPQITEDGTRVLVTVRTADREHDRWTRRLDMVRVADGTRTTIPTEHGFSAPRWSPDGKRIAYIADHGVWVTSADESGANGSGASGSTGNGSSANDATANGSGAQRVTAEYYDVVQFAWRPDGNALAFVAIDRAAAKTGDAKYLDAYSVGNDAALAEGAARPAHLFLQPLDGAPARALGPRTGSVASGDAESTLSFTPDGKTLAYVWSPTNVGNDAVGARVHLVDVATARDTALPGFTNEEHDPLWSPEGTRLAYMHSGGDDQLHPVEVFLTTPSAGAQPVSHAVDRAVRDIGWQPGSSSLYFTVTDGTKHVLFRSRNGARPEPVALGALSITSGLDGAIARNGSIAFTGETANRAPELYLQAPDGGAPARLTSYNDAFRSIALAGATRITYHTAVGVDGDAVLVKPAAMQPGRRYPLVVVIHGGPTAASTEGFDVLEQLLAARGWLVLEPNYRGSNNLGARYQRAVGGDKLRGPGNDIDAAIAAVRRLGIVDERRMAVSGWSYGAGLTLWMIEHRHDWRAAVAGAAVTDIAADYATADDIAADRALLGGSPLIAPYRARAASMSPITYADRVRTPLLLMTCRGDTRVSPVGVYEFYHALRDLGRPVQLIAYPVDGHFPSDPVRRNDVYRRWIAFIAERFGA